MQWNIFFVDYYPPTSHNNTKLFQNNGSFQDYRFRLLNISHDYLEVKNIQNISTQIKFIEIYVYVRILYSRVCKMKNNFVIIDPQQLTLTF